MLIARWLGIWGDRTYFGTNAGDRPLTVNPFLPDRVWFSGDDREIGMTVDAIANAVFRRRTGRAGQPARWDLK